MCEEKFLRNHFKTEVFLTSTYSAWRRERERNVLSEVLWTFSGFFFFGSWPNERRFSEHYLSVYEFKTLLEDVSYFVCCLTIFSVCTWETNFDVKENFADKNFTCSSSEIKSLIYNSLTKFWLLHSFVATNNFRLTLWCSSVAVNKKK